MTAPAPQRPSSADLAAEDQLVRSHLPLVAYAVTDICRRLPSHVSRDDLTSAGMTALAMAARSFQAERGAPFSRYADRRIAGALLDEMRSQDWASRSVRRRAREQEETAHRLAAQFGRPATAQELAATLSVPVSELEANRADVHRSIVLSFQGVMEANADEIPLPSPDPTPEKVLLDREREAYLHDAVALLPERLRTVVLGIFFDERPVSEIAEELGVTESRVSQMRSEAMALLRDAMNAQLSPESVPVEERPDGRVARRKEAYYAAVAARSDFKSRVGQPRQREQGWAAVSA